jgi:hypothetical protein
MRSLCFLVLLASCHKDATVDPTTAVTSASPPVASVAAAPAARTYPIHLRGPSRVGDRTHVVVDADYTEHTTATLAGQPPKDSTKVGHVHVDGTDTVKELQPDGHSALRDELTVVDFWQTHDSGPSEVVVPKGSRVLIVRAARKEDARVTVNGSPATKAVREAIAHVTELTTKSGASDDEIFGTSTPQPVGGEWDINAALAEKDLVARDIMVVPGSVSGKTRLVAVRPVDGVDCLELDNTLRVGSIASMKDLPPGSTIENASITVRLHVLVPVDGSREAPDAKMGIHITGTFNVPSPKGPVRVVLDSEDNKHLSSDVVK